MRNFATFMLPMIKSRGLSLTGHVARMVETRIVYRILVGKPDGEKPLARPRHKWENNIRTS
jgi:hypothetical protein